ncbi:lysozyme-like domain-containing protein [Flammula alnicola]|nr:lysozyme-like domain-containing protein [Flammula alnicola]
MSLLATSFSLHWQKIGPSLWSRFQTCSALIQTRAAPCQCLTLHLRVPFSFVATDQMFQSRKLQDNTGLMGRGHEFTRTAWTTTYFIVRLMTFPHALGKRLIIRTFAVANYTWIWRIYKAPSCRSNPPTLTMIFIALSLLAASFAHGAVNDACTAGSTPGVCLTTSSCFSGGGTSHAGFCPNDPTDVQCCTKACGSGGTCRFSNTCSSGRTQSGLCPGPSNFLCCLPSATCGPPAVNAATISLIKQFEGFVPSPAPDPIGLPTVGYGHLCQTTNCGEVPFSFPLTEAEATTLLNSDLKTFEACITSDINSSIRLNDNQYGALSSWAFNEGCGNAGGSTLIARLNAGEDPNTVAAQELPKWVFAGGVVLQGLVNRRAAEVQLFQTASSIIAHPPSC